MAVSQRVPSINEISLFSTLWLTRPTIKISVYPRIDITHYVGRHERDNVLSVQIYLTVVGRPKLAVVVILLLTNVIIMMDTILVLDQNKPSCHQDIK